MNDQINEQTNAMIKIKENKNEKTNKIEQTNKKNKKKK